MSRLTFREKQPDTCWQKQIRDAHLAEGAPPVSLDLKAAMVRRVSRRISEQVVLKYEWLGTLPAGCTHHYGIFFGNYCAGVTCISVGGGGANVYAYKEFGLRNQQEFAYLARGANVHWSPTGANSKLVSWTCKLLAKDSGAKIIIAYADTDAGEIGTIYQACNWVCIGRGSSTRQWVAPSGRVLDQKLASNLAKQKGGSRAQWVKALKASGWVEQESNPKFRYVYVLDKTDRRLIDLVEGLRVPYPKREPKSETPRGRSADSGTTDVQSVSGGASPTRPLLDRLPV